MKKSRQQRKIMSHTSGAQVCKFGTVLNNLIFIEPFSLSFSVYLDLSWSILVYLDLFCSSRSILVQLGLFWSISIYNGLSCAILTYLPPFRTKMGFLGLSRVILGSIGLSQDISSYLGFSCAISGRNELSWLSLDIFCYLWLSLVISGSLWLSLSSVKY